MRKRARPTIPIFDDLYQNMGFSMDVGRKYVVPQLKSIIVEMQQQFGSPEISAIFAKRTNWKKNDYLDAINRADLIIRKQCVERNIQYPQAHYASMQAGMATPPNPKHARLRPAPGSEANPRSFAEVLQGVQARGGQGIKPASVSNDPKKGCFTINRKHNEDWVRFGPRYLINKRKLRDSNELALVYPNGCKPNLIRNQTLSEDLKECIMQYLNGDIMETMNLTPHETTYLKWIWANTGMPNKGKPAVYKMLPKYVGPVSGMKERLKVLIGEVTAGNDNSALMIEVRELKNKLTTAGALTESEISKLDTFINL
jgi:hypothetical protein